MYRKNKEAHKDGIELNEIAKHVGGKLLENTKTRAFGVCGLDTPEKGCVAFYLNKNLKSLENKYKSYEFSVVLVNEEADTDGPLNLNYIVVKDPRLAHTKVVELFYNPFSHEANISDSASIHSSVELGKNVCIEDNVVINEGVKIGDNTVIKSGTKIYADVEIGDNCLIHSNTSIREETIIKNNVLIQNNAVIGADGFGYQADPETGLRTIPQVGSVLIEDNVHIGASTCIDRATFGKTIIGQGTKIDNQVQIGHNVKVGMNCILCGQVGIGGSAVIGNQVILGGSSKVSDHRKVADGCVLGGGAIVFTDLEETGAYSGIPAVPANVWKRNLIHLANLSKNIKELKKKIR